ncbi:hypothetical protein BC832DRAFT_539542 [Gaertneriomyces semiglobifer]|nr:hypothetical protein BC832DRAFT_539542 [Gaertneriomyces semiglobifer]
MSSDLEWKSALAAADAELMREAHRHLKADQRQREAEIDDYEYEEEPECSDGDTAEDATPEPPVIHRASPGVREVAHGINKMEVVPSINDNEIFEFPVDNKEMSTIESRIELCDEEKLKVLLRNPYLDTKVKKQLKEYWKSCYTGNTNEFRVEYTYSKYSINGSGRLFARSDLGLQGFPKSVRAFLSADFYVDVDQVNSAPTILAHLCEMYGIECKELGQYVGNRQMILQKYNIDKEQVISMLMKGYVEPKIGFFRAIHQAIYGSLVPKLQAGDTFYTTLWKHIQSLRHKKISPNRTGSFLSLVVQTLENQALQRTIQYLEENNISPDVLIFDGLQARRDPVHVVDENTLHDIQQYVKQHTGMDIPLAIKPMIVKKDFYKSLRLDKINKETPVKEEDPWAEYVNKPNDIHVDADKELSVQRAQEIFDKRPADLIGYLNHYFAKVTNETSVMYCYRDTPSEQWIIRKKNETRAAKDHYNIQVPDKRSRVKTTVSLFSLWDKHPYMMTLKNIVMDPSFIGDKPHSKLNLFRGFQATLLEEYSEELIAPIRHHIYTILNAGVEEHGDFTEKWMASILQKPFVKTETAIVNFSKQGIGKNVFWEFFGKFIIGREHYLYLNDLDIFVLGDEVAFAGGHKTNNKLKSLITQVWQKLEKKGVDSVMIDAFMNFVFLSNQDNCVRVEESDRRYFVKESSSCQCGNEEYFKKLALSLTQEVADHYYTYLMSIDLTGFNPRKVPDTQEKEDMKVWAKTPSELFADDLLEGNIIYQNLVNREGKREAQYFEQGKTYEITTEVLFSKYKEFIEQGYGGRKANGDVCLKGFGKLIKKRLQIAPRSTNRRNGTQINLTVARVPT